MNTPDCLCSKCRSCTGTCSWCRIVFVTSILSMDLLPTPPPSPGKSLPEEELDGTKLPSKEELFSFENLPVGFGEMSPIIPLPSMYYPTPPGFPPTGIYHPVARYASRPPSPPITNSYIHNIEKYVVVDASGKRKPKFQLSRSVTIHPRKDQKESKSISFANEPTILNLYDLSRAIFEHGDPFKHEYLTFLYNNGKHYNQMRALKFFWDRNWRPTADRKVIIRNPFNPYSK